MQTSKTSALLALNKQNYQPEPGSEHKYHVRIEQKRFSPTDGERLSKPRIQIVGEKAFRTTFKRNAEQHGWTVDILHDPTEWLRENKELAEQRANEREQIARDQKQAQQQKAIDDAVAAALAKQQESQQAAIDKAVAAALKSQAAKQPADKAVAEQQAGEKPPKAEAASKGADKTTDSKNHK